MASKLETQYLTSHSADKIMWSQLITDCMSTTHPNIFSNLPTHRAFYALIQLQWSHTVACYSVLQHLRYKHSIFMPLICSTHPQNLHTVHRHLYTCMCYSVASDNMMGGFRRTCGAQLSLISLYETLSCGSPFSTV